MYISLEIFYHTYFIKLYQVMLMLLPPRQSSYIQSDINDYRTLKTKLWGGLKCHNVTNNFVKLR